MSRFISVFFALVLLALPATAMAAYVIKPGDTLQIEVVEDSSLNRTVLVLPDGSISFPGAGTVRAAGNSVDTVRHALSSRLAAEFTAPPSVYVAVQKLYDTDEFMPEKAKIYMMGEVNSPGMLEVEKGITLLQAIASAGGFTRFAATKRVELHRVDPQTHAEQIYLFDYKHHKGISGGTLLTDGDVISVPERHLFE
ncbi:polysaccharide biosynthesis/export family protein [Thioclava sp. FTW29]|uniref:Polysaccharide biosynthesis/export family protein n=1 Tax=Thioclava litoralis TaxID=3076557 RepID=A0ABZ1E5S2_9RHOB|nr:polysaccharide biosynthesis/export family protein [Thioclava sp. FTW29]